MWRTLKAVGKRVGTYSPHAVDTDAAPEFPEEHELRPRDFRRGVLGGGSGRRNRNGGYEEPEAELYQEGVSSTSGRGVGFTPKRRGLRDPAPPGRAAAMPDALGRDRRAARDTDRGGWQDRGNRDPERERQQRDGRDVERPSSRSRKREGPQAHDDLPEETRLLPNGRLAQFDPGGEDGDWRLGNQGYGAVERLWKEQKGRIAAEVEAVEEEEEENDPENQEAYERNMRVLRIMALREYYDTRRRTANILLLGTCALDPALRVGLSVGPNRGVSTLLTPAPTFNAGYAVAYVFCLVYALFQALPAEAPRPLLRRIGWLSGLMFASQSTVALLARHATPLSRLWGGSPWLVRICRRSLIRRCAFSPQSSMLTLSSGSLQHFADFRPDILISHVGGAAPINWAMIFVSIAALLPSGLLMQALMAPQNRHWAFEDHILIAAPLSIWSAWMTLQVGENLAVALLSSGLFNVGLGNIMAETGPPVAILIALTAFAYGFIVTGEGNPYYSLTIIWALIGISEQAKTNFSGVGPVSVVAISAAVVIMVLSLFQMRIRAKSGKTNRWGEVVPLAFARCMEMREADARGEMMRDLNTTVQHASARLQLINIRFKELVSGAVASVTS